MKSHFQVFTTAAIFFSTSLFSFSYTLPQNKLPSFTGFTENKGQLTDMNGGAINDVFFKAQARGLDVYVNNKGLTYILKDLVYPRAEADKESGSSKDEPVEMKWERVEMILKNATITKENITVEEESAHHFNYFYSHCPGGIMEVREYKKIKIANIYPGIDWILYANQDKGFEYDFVLHPWADAALIKMTYSTINPLNIDNTGNLLIAGNFGTITEFAPETYIQSNGIEIKSAFVKASEIKPTGHFETEINFELDSRFTRSGETIVIDPQLVWSTFYGASASEGIASLDVDVFGNAFVCGFAGSLNLPVQNANTYFQGTGTAFQNAFILKFSNAGALVWGTYYGGTGSQEAHAVACDYLGNVFIVGRTTSTVFPLQNAGGFYQSVNAGGTDYFVLKFNNAGTRLWATLMGGTGSELGIPTCATDKFGNLFLTGTTSSANFPLQNNATYFQGTYVPGLNSFIAKFNSNTALVWSTFFEKVQCEAINTDNNGNVLITGSGSSTMTLLNPGGGAYYQATQAGQGDATIHKFDNSGNLLWSTFYGGSVTDRGRSVAADKNGNIFVVGVTSSPDLPLQNAGAFFQATSTSADIFILKFNSAGVRSWATYMGGPGIESMLSAHNLDIDSCGSIVFAFESASSNMACVTGCDGGYNDCSLDGTATQPGPKDEFICRFSNVGVLLWSTFFGGDGYEFRTPLDMDKGGSLFLGGQRNYVTNSASYPLVNPGGGAYFNNSYSGSDDSFMAKFTETAVATSFSYPNLICVGDSVKAPTLSPNFISGGTFSSSPGLNLNAGTGQITPLGSIPGNYTVTYGAPSCLCVNGNSLLPVQATVSIKVLPLLSVTGNFSICPGESTTLTALGGSVYIWSGGQTTSTVSVLPLGNTVYTVVGTGASGCSATATVQVKMADCTGIGKVEQALFIRIYPNPNKGDFTIESNVAVNLDLFNELGQAVRSITLSKSNSGKVRLTGLAKGIYFLSGETENKKQSYKIVVE